MFTLRSLTRRRALLARRTAGFDYFLARIALVYLASLTTACGDDAKPNELGLRVSFVCDSDRVETHALRLRVLEGGCGGDGKALYEAMLERGEEAPPVDRVGSGRYGVEATAYAEQKVVASTCVEVSLPRSEAIALKLRSDACTVDTSEVEASTAVPMDAEAETEAGAARDANVADAGAADVVDSSASACLRDCSDSDPCTDDLCVNGACTNPPHTGARECDGIPCTLGDMCAAGVCQAGTPNDAACEDDGNPCSAESCVAGVGCNRSNANADGRSCNDNIACTSPDICSNGVCSGTDTCTGSQVCSAVSRMCVSCKKAQDCDDLDPCTTDACAGGICSHTNNSAACDDGKSCTGNDVCAAGHCAGVSTCPSDATCGGSNCLCNDGSETLCGNSCVNLSNTASDCGLCGRACASGASCQNGACKPGSASTCTAYRNGGHDYLVCADTLNWSAARDRCRSFDLVLVVIDNQAENDFVRDRLGGVPGWIGANDLGATGSNCRLSGEEGSWYWASSVSDDGVLFCSAATSGPVSCSPNGGHYQNWNFGEPNNGCTGCTTGCGEGQDCASIDPPGTWDDDSCSAPLGYICETP